MEPCSSLIALSTSTPKDTNLSNATALCVSVLVVSFKVCTRAFAAFFFLSLSFISWSKTVFVFSALLRKFCCSLVALEKATAVATAAAAKAAQPKGVVTKNMEMFLNAAIAPVSSPTPPAAVTAAVYDACNDATKEAPMNIFMPKFKAEMAKPKLPTAITAFPKALDITPSSTEAKPRPTSISPSKRYFKPASPKAMPNSSNLSFIFLALFAKPSICISAILEAEPASCIASRIFKKPSTP